MCTVPLRENTITKAVLRGVCELIIACVCKVEVVFVDGCNGV